MNEPRKQRSVGNYLLTLSSVNDGGGVALLLRFNREEARVMAAILPFVPRAAAKTIRPQREAAAIIIFPGVRYERIPNGPTNRREALRPAPPRPGPARH